MKYKPYGEYKDSDVEWIGNIPKGWEVKKLKFEFSIINGATPKSDNDVFWDGDIVWVTPADYSTNDMYIKDSKRKITLEGLNSCATRVVPVGSIIISNRAPIGLVSINEVLLSTNQGCKALVKKKISDERYYYYYIATQEKTLNMLGKGTTFLELSNYELGSFISPSPPIETQIAIADYLDTETAKIASIISAKQKLIEKLQEKRSSIISHAVTKGLDPTAKMRPSGIEWIGDIPEEWEVKKLSWLFTVIGSGTTPNTNDSSYYNGDVPWVNTGDLNDGLLEQCEKFVTQSALDDFPTLRFFEKGALLIAMYGATIGKLSIISFNATTNQACCALDKPKGVNVKYIFYWLLGMRENIISLAYGGGQPNISQNLIKNLRIPISINEQAQTAIADYLDTETAKIDAIITKTKASIEKLNEYKTALISACVTGKIDVRGAR